MDDDHRLDNHATPPVHDGNQSDDSKSYHHDQAVAVTDIESMETQTSKYAVNPGWKWWFIDVDDQSWSSLFRSKV